MKKLNNLSEKLRALADGEKIRCSSWPQGEFIYVKNNMLFGETNSRSELVFIDACDEIYEAPKDENLYEWMTLKEDGFRWNSYPVLMTKERAKEHLLKYYYDYAIKSGPYNPKEFKKG